MTPLEYLELAALNGGQSVSLEFWSGQLIYKSDLDGPVVFDESQATGSPRNSTPA
jgi:hypothetical protein